MDQLGYPTSITQLIDSYVGQRKSWVRVGYDFSSNYWTLEAALLKEKYYQHKDRTILGTYADEITLATQM